MRGRHGSTSRDLSTLPVACLDFAATLGAAMSKKQHNKKQDNKKLKLKSDTPAPAAALDDPKKQKTKPARAERKDAEKRAEARADDLRKGYVPKGITNREFKLLLKPDGLERRRTVAGFQSFMQDFCAKRKVEYLPNETAATGLRNIIFYDTPDEDLRDRRIILRVRASRKDLWVDEWCEITLKCRHDDFNVAAAFDPTPHFEENVRSRLRFKEEILRGADPDTPRLIYSNNAIINTVPLDRLEKHQIGEIYPVFPGLGALNIAADKAIGKVGGDENTILEAAIPLGMIAFDDDVVAHCDLGVWFRSAGVPLIGELAFAYRVNPENRKNHKAHKAADRFFAKLQSALGDQLSEGSTKTALVYGKPE